MTRQAVLAVIIAILGSSGIYAQNAPPDENRPANQEDFIKKTEKISKLLDQLNSDSLTTQLDAAKELASFGRESIPFVSEHLKTINHAACAAYLEELGKNLSKNSLPPETALSKEQLAELADSVKDKNSVIKAYVYLKYLDAAALFKEGKYNEALLIINAVLALDKPPEYADRIKTLKIKCEEHVVSEQILNVSISQDTGICQSDQPVVYNLKIENVGFKPVQLAIKPPDDPNTNPFCKINIDITEYTAVGNFSSDNRIAPINLDIDIELKPNESWKTTLVLDTSSLPPQTAPYRTYEISASIRPTKLVCEKKDYYREIVSNSMTVKVFPVKLDDLRKQPLALLGKVLDKGNADEIFICSLLVNEEDKPAAEEMLMVALNKAESIPEKRLFMNCLKHLTGKTLPFEEDEWLNWWKQKPKKQ
ncbi:MAG: hypothetical protein HZA48_00795 [Planctomycetes bacterium]|nr:hypothetical protein [Planctomycetota bacterium]